MEFDSIVINGEKLINVPVDENILIDLGMSPKDATSLVESKLNEIDIQSSIESVEKMADFYHEKLIGTTNEKKAKRYELNVKHAKAILSGSASDVVRAVMQKQLDADKLNDPDVFSEMDLKSFCEWLVNLGELSEVAAPLIETIRIEGKAKIKAAKTSEERSLVKSQLAERAEVEYKKLMQGAY